MKMRLKQQFVLLGALTLGLLLILSGLAALQLHRLQIKEEQRYLAASEFYAAGLQILNANVEFKKQVQHWKNILLRGNNPADFDNQKTDFLKQQQLVQQSLQAAANVRQESANDQVAINALITEHQQLSEQYQKVLLQFDPKDALSGQKIDAQIRGIDQSLTDALQNKVDALAKRERELRQINDTTTQHDLQQAKLWIALTSLLCIVTLISLMYVTLISVLRQIGGDPQEAMFVTRQVARGNLAVQIKDPLPHSVLSHLQDMVYGLSDLIADIHQTCTALNKMALHVDSAAALLAQNSAEQARVVAMNSSSLEQIAATVAQNAEHSKKLALLLENTTPETADLITEINCASKEQATAIADNSKNLLKLSQRTHENAQQAKKLSLTANGLYAQTHQLNEMLNEFKTA